MTTGDWSDANNWVPPPPAGQVPGANDTITIPAGHTCEVKLANQSIRSMTVAGRLDLADRTLTLGSPTLATTTTLSGTINLFDSFPPNPAVHSTIRAYNHTTLSGGIIVCENGKPAEITWAGAATDTLHLSGMLVTPQFIKGGIFFNLNISTNAWVTLSPNGPDNFMYFGPEGGSAVYAFSGDATIDVGRSEGGTVTCRKVNLNGATGEWKSASGAEIETGDGIVLESACIADATAIYFNVLENGLLDLRTDIHGRGLAVGSGALASGSSAYGFVTLAQPRIAVFAP